MIQKRSLCLASFGLIGCALLLLVPAGGCRLSRSGSGLSAGGPAAPEVIPSAATAAEIVTAINRNSASVRSYAAPNASFTMPGLPGLPLLRGSVVLEKPKRFRLKAGTALSGEEVDLGSNDETYWLWAKRNEPPAIYFARHDQPSAAAAQLLPIDPSWVIDALGLVQLNPAASYQGPLPRADGTLEIRHTEIANAGSVHRVTVVDPSRAWVLEQHVYNAQGQLLASAVAKDFRYHPTAQASIPERVTITMPSASLSLTINTGTVTLNAPISNPQQHWVMPTREGYPLVDLGRSDGLPIQGVPAAAITPAMPVTQTRPAASIPQLGALTAPVLPATTQGYQGLPAGGVVLQSASPPSR